MAFDPKILDEASRFLGFDRPGGSSISGDPLEGDGSTYLDAKLARFAKSNPAYETNSLMAFQDPTCLGFKLLFLFDQPNSGLLSTVAHPNTAMGYLERIGDTERAYYLKQFVNLLRDINTQCPWYWQTVEGLDSAWKRGFHEDEFKPKYEKGTQKMVIGCLESVDLRVTALMDLYRKACFDWEYKREIVPWNLRLFNMRLYVYELRTFNRNLPRDRQEFNRKLLASREDPGNDVEQMNRVLFEFDMCEWLPDESAEMFSGVSNSAVNFAQQKLAFKYHHVRERNIYNLFSDKYVADDVIRQLDRAALDDPEFTGKVQIEESEQAKGLLAKLESVYDKNAVSQAARDQAEARVRGFVRSQVGAVLLGNIYGLSLTSLAAAAEGGVVSLAQGAARLAAGAGNSVTNNTGQAGGRYFDTVTPNQPGQASGNAMADTFGPESDGNPGTSLVNYTDETGPIANTSIGPSLLNQVGDAGGNIATGPSLQNQVEDAGGNLATGSSLQNQVGTPTGSMPSGESAANVDGEASGSVGGGPSVANQPGTPTGSVGGGPSLNNGPGPASVLNMFDGQQPSRANVDGAASGAVGGGESITNVADDASGSVGGGESLQNYDPDDPRGSVGGGDSLRNNTGEARGNVYHE